METVRFLFKKLLEDRVALLGAVLILSLIIAAIFAPLFATHPEDVAEFHPALRLMGPNPDNWFGTDRMGSDIYSRILFGARITITIAVIAIGASVLIGVPIGLIAGWYTGWFSDLLMRTSDVFLAVPQIVLAIAIAQTLGPSIENVILALSATYCLFGRAWSSPKPARSRMKYSSRRALRSVHRRCESWCITCCQTSPHR